MFYHILNVFVSLLLLNTLQQSTLLIANTDISEYYAKELQWLEHWWLVYPSVLNSSLSPLEKIR